MGFSGFQLPVVAEIANGKTLPMADACRFEGKSAGSLVSGPPAAHFLALGKSRTFE